MGSDLALFLYCWYECVALNLKRIAIAAIFLRYADLQGTTITQRLSWGTI